MRLIIFFSLGFILFVNEFAFAQNSVLDFYQADMESIKKTNPKAEITLEEVDVNNGFVSYRIKEHSYNNLKNIAYFISNNGKKFIAMASITCDVECIITNFRFYELENEELIDKTFDYFPQEMNVKLDEAINEKIPKNQNLWIKVPKEGTVIQFGYFKIPSKRVDNFIVVCELHFNVENGTFSFVEIN